MRSLTFWKSSMVTSSPTDRRYRDQVEHGIGRAAGDDRHDHRVLERARVMMSRGLRSSSTVSTACPARTFFELAGVDRGDGRCEGRAMPSASIALAMVLAVCYAAAAPAGAGVADDLLRWSSVILPARCSPYDWNADTTSRGFFVWVVVVFGLVQPGLIVPP
ncbi:MAG: hypothetical protein R3C45_08665 [Phycisphaerales bacterium]